MKLTEAGILEALRRRHAFSANGGSGRYAFLTHVRTGAAFDQQEIDAVVVALWPSEYHDLHAFEVKCSRSDWLREIKPDTHKSRRTRDLADTFTIVAPKGAVRDGELPEGWGLMEATATEDEVKLRRTVKPARLTPRQVNGYPRQFSRGLVAAMLRATGCVPGMTTGRKRSGGQPVGTTLESYSDVCPGGSHDGNHSASDELLDWQVRASG